MYRRILAKTMEDASYHLLNVTKTVCGSGSGSKCAVVFDIDGTLLDETTDQAIPEVLALYNLCKDLKIATFIVTAREERPDGENRHYTHVELQRIGVVGYEDLYMRDAREHDIAKQKQEARESIHQRGYVVVMSVGDMFWDIGEFGGIGVLLPRVGETG
jgi:predicted secreted acid phosphatase